MYKKVTLKPSTLQLLALQGGLRFRLTFYSLSFLCFGRLAPAISNWTCVRAGLKGWQRLDSQ
jgi:hypothetical protein